MSNAHSVTKFSATIGSPFVFNMFLTRFLECLLILCKLSSSIRKWKVGVRSFLRLCHFSPAMWKNIRIEFEKTLEPTER